MALGVSRASMVATLVPAIQITKVQSAKEAKSARGFPGSSVAPKSGLRLRMPQVHQLFRAQPFSTAHQIPIVSKGDAAADAYLVVLTITSDARPGKPVRAEAPGEKISDEFHRCTCWPEELRVPFSNLPQLIRKLSAPRCMAHTPRVNGRFRYRLRRGIRSAGPGETEGTRAFTKTGMAKMDNGEGAIRLMVGRADDDFASSGSMSLLAEKNCRRGYSSATNISLRCLSKLMRRVLWSSGAKVARSVVEWFKLSELDCTATRKRCSPVGTLTVWASLP